MKQMTTPEQRLPPQFQETYTPPSGVDPAQADSARRAAERRLTEVQAAKKRVHSARASLSRIEGPQAQKRGRQALLEAQQALARARKTRTTSLKNYYVKSGQYEQLLQGGERDAFMALRGMFESFGLGSLAGKIFEYVQQGYSSDTVTLLLQDTKEYKQRFAGNELRQKKGLPVLSPGEYLATEAAFRQVLNDAGVPKGFYDSPQDFENWIAGDVSPTEVKARVDLAMEKVASADPMQRKALQEMYGVDSGGILAYFIDSKKAVPILERQARAVEIGAAALRRGLVADRDTMQRYASMGVSGAGAEEGFAQVAESLDPMRALAQRFGLGDWTQSMAQQEVFEPGGEATTRGRRLRSQERALFSGRAGGARAGLASGYRQT